MSDTDIRPILYTDLDDTVFQTARKMAEPECETRLGAIATNGHHSYMTVAQSRMLDWLQEATRVVPVTARSTNALSRCQIPFRHWKIAANGAIILGPDGAPLADWQETVRSVSDAARVGLESLDSIVHTRNTHERACPTPRFRHWIVEEYGMPDLFLREVERRTGLGSTTSAPIWLRWPAAISRTIATATT